MLAVVVVFVAVWACCVDLHHGGMTPHALCAALSVAASMLPVLVLAGTLSVAASAVAVFGGAGGVPDPPPELTFSRAS